jgi:hypothetical protein
MRRLRPRMTAAVLLGGSACVGLVSSAPAVTVSGRGGDCTPAISRLPGPGSPEEVNNAGVIIGNNGDTTTALMWRNGTRDVVAHNANAWDINDRGVVVGTLFTADGHHRAYRWHSGVLTQLPGRDGAAFGVNDLGWVVGEADDRQGATRVALWRGNGLEILNADPGDPVGPAVGVNNAGQIIGLNPWVWSDGTFTDLGETFGHPTAIDDAGVVVGVLDPEDGSPMAPIMWTAPGQAQVFDDVPGAFTGTDGAGRFTGYTNLKGDPAKPLIATVWDRAQGFRELRSLSGRLGNSAAGGANLLGTVVGASATSGGKWVPTQWLCAWRRAE